MTPEEKKRRRAEARKARLTGWIAQRASRDTGLVDRLCRRLLSRALQLGPDQDFMRDAWVDSDVGYDPEELARYQRGELREP